MNFNYYLVSMVARKLLWIRKHSHVPLKRSGFSPQWGEEIVIGTDLDPYNKPEHVHTLKGRELCFFVIFYIIAVFLIVAMFELSMPVLFNPNYPDMD
ncbi:hypothetical protein TELCIR_03656 [Teladorsagia circumcincta]|uniref:Uncharacterized protein n=1 Tax=Teladorsagia circumcincta TaxID=45464 RepID=A0A2G9UXW0_TELCI|nr:hypothetical protein TELCIR_03656 [Teladorsagia circumcincta]